MRVPLLDLASTTKNVYAYFNVGAITDFQVQPRDNAPSGCHNGSEHLFWGTGGNGRKRMIIQQNHCFPGKISNPDPAETWRNRR